MTKGLLAEIGVFTFARAISAAIRETMPKFNRRKGASKGINYRKNLAPKYALNKHGMRHTDPGYKPIERGNMMTVKGMK